MSEREVREAAQAMAQGMIELAGMIEPMHEFVQGQVVYFLGQGFRPEEALAMAAAEFVTIFGTMIQRTLPPGWTP